MIHTACLHSHNDSVHRRTHRKTHCKQFSVSKLSSETVQTLPEYSSPPGWTNSGDPSPLTGAESDNPPDYPDTTDEADADTEEEEHVIYQQHLLGHPPSRCLPVHARRRRRISAATFDPFLDTLLERSVRALEMSNALLRSTMSTHSSLSTLLSPENDSDHFLEVRARNLSTRIRLSPGPHATWMDHLDEISEGVDMLLGEERKGLPASHSDEGTVSRSLPTTTMPSLRHRRKPSILELDRSPNSHLRYSHPTRDILIAPAPRALTQYVESTADPQLITLPSTLGLRASGSSHPVHSRESLSAHCPPSIAGISPKTRPESTTPAYHLLSNLVKRSGSLSPPPSARFLCSHNRCASASPTSSVRSMKLSLSPSSARLLHSSLDRSRSRLQAQSSRSRSEIPRRPPTPPTSLPTLPIDEGDSPPSSESSDHLTGYRTVQSLRKILDNHPSSASVNTLRRKDLAPHRPPSFLPITPPRPTQGTSMATASISRLYTKGRHSMSTRPPSPPAHSSLKVRPVSPIPSPSPSTMSLSEVSGNGAASMMRSAPSSGVSTPKRISFAELPEPHSGWRAGTSRLREQRSKKKSKQKKVSDKEEADGWLQTLLSGGLSSRGAFGIASREERMEERMAQGWGTTTRLGYGTLDDWAV